MKHTTIGWTLLAAALCGLTLGQTTPDVGPATRRIVRPPAALPAMLPPEIPRRPPFPVPTLPPPRLELSDPASVPMQIREMNVEAAVRGLHATVETTLVFHNPNARQLEGELVFPLPDGAAVCGYALDIHGVLVEGVLVRKEQARVAFEAETRRQIDPGLVEHVRGNLYRTRIYPLPPHGTRTIRLTYTTPLATSPEGDAALLLPMPRDPIPRRTLRIEVAADPASPPLLGGLGDRRFSRSENLWRVESTDTDLVHGEDVWVALPRLAPTTTAIERTADGTVWFHLSALAPAAAPGATHPPREAVVLWDASGSRAGQDLAADYALLEALPAGLRFRLIAFRDEPEPPRDFDSAVALVAALKKLPLDGGTDFETLTAAAASWAPTTDAVPVLLFSDGFDTLSGKPLELGSVRATAVVSTTLADREALRQACAGALVDLQTTDIATAVRQILNPPPRLRGVLGTGIAELQGVGRPAIGRISVLGRLVSGEATVQLDFGGGVLSAPCHLHAADAREGRTLATAWAAARVMQLAPRAELFEDELLDLGRRFGLVSPATSLLVLESLDQWVRHEIEPPASQPQLREQWHAEMKRRGQRTVDDRERHMAQVLLHWQQRVAWWKTDFSARQVTPQAPKPPVEPGGPVPLPSPAEIGDADELMPAAMSGTADRTRASRAGEVQALAMAEGRIAAPRSAPAFGGGAIQDAADASSGAPDTAAGVATSIRIQPWSPDTPYLTAIRAAGRGGHYDAYLAERGRFALSPAFFLDCAEFFFAQGETALGLRILSNLAELRIEDAALLRVYAWRLRQAGRLDRAVAVLRRVVRLRGEEPQSHRDLALVLADRGRERRSKADVEEAMELFLRVARTPWQRHGLTLAVFALQELNALVAWIGRESWKDDPPTVPDYDERLRENLDTDLRIVLSWDADATDIDLHVVEPGGEEASFRHNRTTRGGLVSQDITDGYGPEEYLIRRAPHGAYTVLANYFGSRQQTVVGPATATATVYTNWGRANEQRQTLALRLDKPRDKMTLGTVRFGEPTPEGTPRESGGFERLRPGMSSAEVRAAVGEPDARQQIEAAVRWRYERGPRVLLVLFDAGDRLVRVSEQLPGGIENLLVQ